MVLYSTANQNLGKEETERKRKRDRNENEQTNNRSQTNRIFRNKNHVNNFKVNENTTSGKSDISTAKKSLNLKKDIVAVTERNKKNYIIGETPVKLWS